MFIERREKTSVGGRMAKHQKLKKRQKKTRKSLIHTTPQKAKDWATILNKGIREEHMGSETMWYSEDKI